MCVCACVCMCLHLHLCSCLFTTGSPTFSNTSGKCLGFLILTTQLRFGISCLLRLHP